MRHLSRGDEDAVSKVFESWIGNCELPVEINVNYDWDPAERLMMLDVDLPEIEDIPTIELTKTDTGKLKEKKKTQGQLKEEYTTIVFGLAIFICANVFNISPAIEKILFSGYTQRRDKNGDLNNDYVYSVKFTRDMFEGEDLSAENPYEFCMSAENRCNMTSTALFKTIKQYESF